MCSTRQTLQKVAYEVGLNPNELYISYVLKCRPKRKYNKELCRSVCIKYLWQQIEFVKPLIVVCLGNVACQSFFENPEIEVKLLRGKAYTVKGY